MQQVQLNERLYQEAKHRAAEAGFASVDEYVAEVLSHDLWPDHDGQTPNLDSLFTPQRLAHIDQAEAQIKSGKFYTNKQATAELAKRRAEWLQKNPR